MAPLHVNKLRLQRRNTPPQLNRIIGHQQVVPFFSAGFFCTLIGKTTPTDRRFGFLLNLFQRNLISALWLDQEATAFGFHHKVGFVVLAIEVFDAKLALRHPQPWCRIRDDAQQLTQLHDWFLRMLMNRQVTVK